MKVQIMFWALCAVAAALSNTTVPSTTNQTTSMQLANVQTKIGLLFGMPPFGILLYIPLLYLIFAKRHKYSNAFYTLVVAVSVNDLYWLFYFLYTGSCLSMGRCPGGDFINTVFTVAAVYGFYMCMFLNLTIAWNRFAAVFFYKFYDTKVFTGRMVAFYLLLAYIASGLANIPAFTFQMKYYVELGFHWFVLNPPPDYAQTWKLLDLLLSYTLHAFIVIMYVAAFIGYRKMHAQLDQAHKKERRFLYQATLNVFPCLLYINCYHFNIGMGELVLALLCMIMNPFVYLWFNKELRTDFMHLMVFKKNGVPIVQVAPAPQPPTTTQI